MGESVCSRCGLVVEDNMQSQEAEWRAFTPQERDSRARAGTPTNYSHYDKGLSTVIRVERDASGSVAFPKNETTNVAPQTVAHTIKSPCIPKQKSNVSHERASTFI